MRRPDNGHHRTPTPSQVIAFREVFFWKTQNGYLGYTPRLTFLVRLLILPGMKRLLGGLLTAIALCAANFTVCAETDQIDLKALAKKARPAVMLLVISDANGKEIATGTGFLVSADGKLITNFHVIEKAASAVAKTENGGLFPVEGVLASDPKNDLVLLKIKGKELPFLTLSNSENIEVGTRIVVIGSPLGLEGTLSEGIVSAVRELMGDTKRLQITAPISPGSSGSPVMNGTGEVVGVATLVLRGGQNLNFAVPVDAVKGLVVAAARTTKAMELAGVPGNQGSDLFADPDFRAGRDALLSGDYAETLKRMKLVADRYPNNAKPYVVIGITYQKLKFYEDAVAALKHAIQIDPNDATPWIAVGVIYIEQEEHDKAVGACRQAVKIAPDNNFAWLQLGHAYFAKWKFADAGVALQQAIRLNPETKGAWGCLVACLGNLRSGSRELLTSSALLAKNTLMDYPEHQEAWLVLRLTHDLLDRNSDLVSYCESATKERPSSYEAWFALAIAEMRQKRFDQSIAACRKAIELKPDAWQVLGDIYMAQGKHDDAIAAYLEATRRVPDNSGAWADLGDVYRKQSKWDEAIIAYEKEAKLSRNDNYPLYKIGMVYMERGQRDKAHEVVSRLEKSGSVIDQSLAKELAKELQSGP